MLSRIFLRISRGSADELGLREGAAGDSLVSVCQQSACDWTSQNTKCDFSVVSS